MTMSCSPPIPIPVPYKLANNNIVKDIYTFKIYNYNISYYSPPLDFFKDYKWLMYEDFNFNKDVYLYGNMIYGFEDDNIICVNKNEIIIQWNDSYDIEEMFNIVTLYKQEKITFSTIVDTIVDFYIENDICPEFEKCIFNEIRYNKDENVITVIFNPKYSK